MDIHEAKCTYMPAKCKWCKEDIQDEEVSASISKETWIIFILRITIMHFLGGTHVPSWINFLMSSVTSYKDILYLFLQMHLRSECNSVPEFCSNGCGEKIPRKDVSIYVCD